MSQMVIYLKKQNPKWQKAINSYSQNVAGHYPAPRVKSPNSIWWTKLTIQIENQPSIFWGSFSVSQNDLQPQTSSNNDAKATLLRAK